MVNNFAAVTRLLASQRQALGPDALLSPMAAHRDHVATLFQIATSSSVQPQAFAVLHLSAESQRALEQARKAVEEIDCPDQVGLFSDWNPARLLVYEGTCWLFLGEPMKAVDALNEALTAMDQGSLNVALAARVDLASAYADEGELEEGCRLLGDAYADLAEVGNLHWNGW